MKSILIYGDSNTWGQMAFDGRYSYQKRWPKILQRNLGPDIDVIQSGVCARTAGDINKEKNKTYRNGRQFFDAVYHAATPVDLLIIALGTNDLKEQYKQTADEIMKNLLWYKNKAKSLRSSNGNVLEEVLYVLPPNFKFISNYFPGDENLRQELNAKMKEAEENIIEVNNLELSEDGVHFSINDHITMANKVEHKIRGLFE